MNFVEILLSEKLRDKNPMLELTGSDRKVLQIACKDMTNYLKVSWGLIGKDSSECYIAEKLQKIFKNNRKELEEFLDVWTGIWFRKWKERVKLLIGNDNSKRWNHVSKLLEKAEPVWKGLSHRQEMEDVVVSTLVKNAEICGTSILAENLLKMELGVDKKKYMKDEEHILDVVNSAIRKARELTQSRGPLIFVKVDKGYYESVH